MDKAARAALLTAKGIKSNRAAYALGGSEDGIDVYHASPSGIVGKFKPSQNDVGIHFAANPDLAHNAAVKSAFHKPRNAENIAVQKFRINAKPEQIVDIPQQGNRFDFYDILEHLHGTGRIDEGTFNKTYDKLQEIEDRDMTYERMNPVFSRALAKSNIKALRYMNDFDAGPTWKDMNEGRMTSHVTPDHSYMVTDPSAIEYPEGHKAFGGAVGKSTGGALDKTSENIADYVADLLRQGRAKEVTDDLMAQADPQRLHHHYTTGNTGMDMPMDKASRMARAKGMGFSDENLYHGTMKDFQSFSKDTDKVELNFGENQFNLGHFLTNDPRYAGQYAVPAYNGQPGGPNVMPVRARANLAQKDRALIDDIETNWNGDQSASLVDKLSKNGFGGIDFGAVRYKGQTPTTEVSIFDPTNIRSQFARFDPRLDHLAHLSASTGGAMEFARHVMAKDRAGGQIAPSKYLPNVPRAVHADGGKVDFVKDNPGGDWLANKQNYAFEYPRMKGIDGAITGWMGGKSDLFLPTHVLKSIEPLNNEKRVAGEPRFDDLMSSVSKEGFDPHQKGNKVVVAVNHRGQPFVLEGNTRVAVAHAMGVPSVKAEVRYWNGAEEADGPMHPDKVSAMASDSPDITKAEGGRIHAEGGGKMELRSRAAEAIRNQPQLKGNVNQLLAVAAKGKGVKQAELLNAGRPAGNIVSKEELAKHFEDAVPDVRVERLGGRDSNKPYKYSDWTLPDGENYREHLLHLPSGDTKVNHKVFGAFPRDFGTEAEAHEYINLMNRAAKEPGMESIRSSLERYPLNYGTEASASENDFKSGHWGTPNVVAHVRMDDRDNGKTLHVQEVQSDWGQHGREHGFYDPKKPIEVFHTGTGETVHATDDMGEAKAKAEQLGPQYDYGRQDDEKAPQGPYVGNTQQWTDLAVKHALTEAAKGGHDRVVFSPGQANADMYGQRNPITEADLVSDPNYPEILGHLHTYDSASRKQNAPIQVENETHLAKILGKEHARDILAEPLSNLSSSGMKSQFISGPNMAIGGHGMVDYYNNIVHPSALKLLQQHDPSIKPESYDLPNGYKGFSLPMTDTARQSILKNGFGAFKRGGTVGKADGGSMGDDDGITAYHGSPHSFDQFDIGKLGTGEGAQAYGHGLYFAGNENIARSYRDTLAPQAAIKKALTSGDFDEPRWRAASAVVQQGGEDKALSILRDNVSRGHARSQQVINAIRDGSYKDINLPKGHMYKVKLNVKPHELLDWDKPLSEQHPNISDKINNVVRLTQGERERLPIRNVLELLGDPKTASEKLLGAGIKGIRYLDAGSRDLSDGDPTHNYVMFHHDPVQVTDKYEYGGAIPKARDVSAALALTRRFTKDGAGATMALKPKGK